MRKRINDIARGRFEYAKPILSFSEDQIEFSVIEGREYSGSFEFHSTNNVLLRGVVYSTNPRMECLTPQFEGDEIKIRFQFKSKGLVEGDRVEGSFLIVCNDGEYSLSFCANISRLYPEASTGIIKNLYDFSCLAKEHWKEAYQLFYHKSFGNIISDKEVKERMVYNGIVAAKPSHQNMEEFLIGIKKKKRISFSLDKSEAEFYDFDEIIRDQIAITKDDWGYIELKVETDVAFIQLAKNRITLDDFVGDTFHFEYMIDPQKLHGGRNYGRLFFSSAYEKKCVEIIADVRSKDAQQKEEIRLQIQESKVGLMELYQAYRLKRMVTGVWANETIEILNHLQVYVPDEPMYVLMKAQAFIINRQRQEAEWILDDFKREWTDRKSVIWGYYLYLMTLMEREPSYVDRMTKEIELIFHENPNSSLLFWVLTFLQEQYYNNNARKLKAIEYWVMKGCASPYLYVEAYYLILQDPYLLTKLEKFELRILRWAVKHHALNKEISEQIFKIIEVTRGFEPVLFQLLCAAYEVNPTPENVGMICSYLIKGQQYNAKYHDWFEKGIELELRITGLYEAYLLSMDDRKVSSIPKIIQMYFQYDSTLSYRNLAVLYNNIIAGKESNHEMYEKYQSSMSKFAMQQLEQGHMDDNLAVLYQDMLDIGLVNEELAHSLSRIIFMNKLIVFEPNLVRAIIYQEQMKDPQIVPIVNRTAYFQLFSKDYVILFEDERGRRFVGSVSYRLQKLMEVESYIEKCMELAPDEITYIIWAFHTKQNYLTFTDKDKAYFGRILFGKETSDDYKARMAPEVLRFYQNRPPEDVVTEYLAHTDFGRLTQSARKYLMDMLVKNRMYDMAYELIQEYGMDQISGSSKMALACHMLEQVGEEKDEQLLLLGEQTFLEHKYNEVILKYLCQYYNGPTTTMVQIWNAAQEFEVYTLELEERILAQMIYAAMELEDVMDIFRHYLEHNGRDLVVLAFLSSCAHAYFVKRQATSELVFETIQERYQNDLELNDACKLGLLLYLAEKTERTTQQYEILDQLLAEYTSRNMNFAFYKKLDHELVMKYHLYDKVFLEYRTKPENHVVIHYSRDEDGQEFIVEDMPDVYDGIFVKSFVVFFGEMIQYYITEEHGNKVEVTESNRIMGNDMYSKEDESRYNLLNQMLISNTLQEEASLFHMMKQYAGYEEVTQKVFKLL